MNNSILCNCDKEIVKKRTSVLNIERDRDNERERERETDKCIYGT